MKTSARNTLLIGLLLAAPAANASPREQLEIFFRRATTILEEATSAARAEDDIHRLAQPLFDVRSAARSVLDAEWRTLSVAQQEEFVRLFGDRLRRAYLGLVRGLIPRGQRPTVRVVAEEIGAGRRVALVRTVVTAKDGADVRFDYVMTRASATWLVQDVVIDGVSLVGNYRAQVVQVLQTSSYDGLVARLRTGAFTPERPTPAWRAPPPQAEETP